MRAMASRKKEEALANYRLIDVNKEEKRISPRRDKWRINLRIINMDKMF